MTWKETSRVINKYSATISDWLNIDQQSLNIEKTELIAFLKYSDRLPKTINVNLKSMPIKIVENTKYLEVIIDQHLRRTHQIKNLVKRS